MQTAMVVIVVALLAAPAWSRAERPQEASPRAPIEGTPRGLRGRGNTIYWFDDMESGEGQWTHGDLTPVRVPHFHRDTFLACPDSIPPSWSWWCGTFDYDDAGELPGGYGNCWIDYLELPPVELGFTAIERASWGAIKARYRDNAERDASRPAPIQPILSFSYRYETEPDYDFIWVQADSFGVWTNLNNGWCGSSGGWRDFGEFGFPLMDYGDPVRIRFYFFSDGAASDEDIYYDSDGGACHVDNIRIFDAVTGEILFLEDCEDQGSCVCVPGSTPPGPGDFWHIQDRPCKASSGTHAWWCGDDADTSHLPPGLNNYLMTPLVHVENVMTCTVNTIISMAFPSPEGTWRERVTLDGGQTFYELGGWYGDQANWGYGPCVLFPGFVHGGQECIPHLAPYGTLCGLMYVVRTPDGDPYGPGGNGDVGITIDDAVLFGHDGVP